MAHSLLTPILSTLSGVLVFAVGRLGYRLIVATSAWIDKLGRMASPDSDLDEADERQDRRARINPVSPSEG